MFFCTVELLVYYFFSSPTELKAGQAVPGTMASPFRFPLINKLTVWCLWANFYELQNLLLSSESFNLFYKTVKLYSNSQTVIE